MDKKDCIPKALCMVEREAKWIIFLIHLCYLRFSLRLIRLSLQTG